MVKIKKKIKRGWMTFALSVFPFYLISSLTKQRKKKSSEGDGREEGRKKREEENDPEMEVAIIKDTSHESLTRMRPHRHLRLPLPTFSPTPRNGVSPFVEQRHS
eukprot:TRINITY_DN6281_c1_g1_i4.p1 TRINITY_DN6281_c1_g1~~TRINITY_DN6281_c1_g1_i4.p1  ORF type:complete len:104 (+),score=13.69 TRINITY_DN6281_c1_g1_i4:319-630(+)